MAQQEAPLLRGGICAGDYRGGDQADSAGFHFGQHFRENILSSAVRMADGHADTLLARQALGVFELAADDGGLFVVVEENVSRGRGHSGA